MGRTYNVCTRDDQVMVNMLIRERVKNGFSRIYPCRRQYSIYDVSKTYILVNHSCSLMVIRTREVYDFSPEDFQRLLRSEWDEVRNDYHYDSHTMSYENALSEETDTPFLDLIEDPEASKPVDEAVREDIKDRIHNLVACLPDKQKRVIETIFFCGKTEEEAAKQLRMSQPLVHYHKDKALERLKMLALEAEMTPDEFEM